MEAMTTMTKRVRTYFAQESVQRVMVLCGMFMANWPITPSAYFGNIFTYTDSYLKFKVGEDPSHCASLVMSIHGVALSLSMTLYKLASRRIGDRLSYVLAVMFFDLSFLLGYWSIQLSVFATVVTLGFLAGTGSGAGGAMCFTFLGKWAPKKNVGFFTALATTTSAGPVFLNFIITKYVNPSNLPATESEANRKYFNEPQILDRVPSLFLLLGGIFIGVHIISLSLIINPESDTEKISSRRINCDTESESETEYLTSEQSELIQRENKQISCGHQKMAEDVSASQTYSSSFPEKDGLGNDKCLFLKSKEKVFFNTKPNLNDQEYENMSLFLGETCIQRETVHKDTIELENENFDVPCQSVDDSSSRSLANESDPLLKCEADDKSKLHSASKSRQSNNLTAKKHKTENHTESGSDKKDSESYILSSLDTVPAKQSKLTTFISPVKEKIRNIFGLNSKPFDHEMVTMKKTRHHKDLQNKGTISTKSSCPDDDKISFGEVLRRKEFWSVWIGAGCTYTSFLILESYYKMFGQSHIEDDHFFAAVAPLVQLSLFGGRLGWGALVDKFGVKPCAMAFHSLGVFSMSFFYFTPLLGKFPFLFGVCMCAFSTAGMFGVYPTAIYRIFGKSHISTVYGMTSTSYIVSSFLFSFLTRAALNLGGWWGIYLVAALCNMIALISCTILMPHRSYDLT